MSDSWGTRISELAHEISTRWGIDIRVSSPVQVGYEWHRDIWVNGKPIPGSYTPPGTVMALRALDFGISVGQSLLPPVEGDVVALKPRNPGEESSAWAQRMGWECPATNSEHWIERAEALSSSFRSAGKTTPVIEVECGGCGSTSEIDLITGEVTIP